MAKGDIDHIMMTNTCCSLLLSALALAAGLIQTTATAACGELISLTGHAQSQIRYAWVPPANAADAVTLLLLVGGSGHIKLDEQGCPRALKGNALIRALPRWTAAGFGVALVDAPSDYQGEDGLAGFRIDPQHAADLGQVIRDLRRRSPGAVWLVGTSRGSISAANAAARLSGPAAADGLVLTSVLLAGQPGARKAWAEQSVFDLPLADIRLPVLIIGHADDGCSRSPPGLMPKLAAALPHTQPQVVTVTGGTPASPGANACEAQSPHGFLGQDAEVAAGIARFVRGGKY